MDIPLKSWRFSKEYGKWPKLNLRKIFDNFCSEFLDTKPKIFTMRSEHAKAKIKKILENPHYINKKESFEIFQEEQ